MVVGKFIEEIGTLYRAYSTGRSSPLAELPIQYADYSYWQRQSLQGESLGREISYWKQQLEGIPTLDLPTDRPRPAVQTFKGAARGLELSEDLTRRLRELSQQQGATLFIMLLAAFDLLLSCYSGQEDIVVGTPVAGRSKVETEGLIGFFVNTLVMRTRLTRGLRVTDLIGGVREVVLGAQTHQELPFEKLVEELQPERSLGRGPLFQVMFSLPNAPGGRLINEDESPGPIDELSFGSVNFKQDLVRFDLTLTMVEAANRLVGSFEYNTDLLDASSVARMASHFKNLLERMVADPNQPLWALPLLTESERHQAVVEWNDTKVESAQAKSILSLIERQTCRRPDAVAVVCGQHHLSYDCLDRRAGRLARRLASLGIGPDQRVALYLRRGLAMVEALLGVIKAGAAYVPVETSQPSERAAYIIGDSGARVVLTERQEAEGLARCDAQVVCLDEESQDIDRLDDDNPDIDVKGAGIIYVLYTSGLTGKPKGVAVSHAGLVNIINDLIRHPGLSEDDVFLAVTSLSFDISMLEVFLPLVSGGRVVIASREEAADGERLINLLTRCGATYMQATPATWRLLLEAGWPGEKGLKTFCGGEALARDIADGLVERSASSWNMYGPTETTIWSTMSPIERGPGTVSIGRPIANTQVYIVDKVFQPVPIGVAGELCIGGEGLARGYLGRTDLTAERFIVNPFVQEPGGRLYRTGDLARYRREGDIEFLGRMDHQVKIRGFRIELGEIESVLGQHPEVDQAIVVAQEERSGERRLVAYVVGSAKLSGPVLRKYLREKLPDYMVPSVFVRIEQAPLTPNGKLDRRALPEPDVDTEGVASTGPRDALEDILCGIWAEVLRREQVGINQNFFELGGHSLLATRVISRIRDLLELEVPLRVLFEGPTVAELAGNIGRIRNDIAGAAAPPIGPASRARELPLSYAQQRLWFLDQLMPGSSLYNMPAAVRLVGPLNVAALEAGIGEIIRRHEVLRTIFPVAGERPVQIVTPPRQLKLAAVDFAGLTDEEAKAQSQEIISREAARPFDIERGPHLRARLLSLGPQDHIVLFTMHHIVSDGWSMALLVKELVSLYAMFDRGEPSALAELRIQYGDFAVWQREWLEGEVLESQVRYWRERLGGGLPLLEMPTDRPRPDVPSHRGARRAIAISKQTSDAVKTLSRQEGVTLFMTLLAAFDVLLHRCSGQRDIIIGTDVANRHRSEVEDLIGFFVNQLVMRVDLSGDPTFRDLLRRVREVALGAYAHQDLPFEKLVEALRPERVLSRAPLFQVKMILQNLPVIQGEGNLTLDRHLSFGQLDGGSSKNAQLDMNLIMVDTPQGLVSTLEYSTDLFEDASAARFLRCFETILELVSADPTIGLGRLVERVTESEERELASRRGQVKEARLRKRKNIEPKPISVMKLN